MAAAPTTHETVNSNEVAREGGASAREAAHNASFPDTLVGRSAALQPLRPHFTSSKRAFIGHAFVSERTVDFEKFQGSGAPLVEASALPEVAAACARRLAGCFRKWVHV